MSPQWEVCLHCEACTGRDRRKDVARVFTHPIEGPSLVMARLRDERGHRMLVDTLLCPRHGPLDIEVAWGRVTEARERWQRSDRRRPQHVTVPPLRGSTTRTTHQRYAGRRRQRNG